MFKTSISITVKQSNDKERVQKAAVKIMLSNFMIVICHMIWPMPFLILNHYICKKQSPENIQFFLGTTRTFQKLPTLMAILFTFLVFFGQNGCTYFIITNFFGIFASHYRKNYPKCNISLVKCQIFLLFMKIFLEGGTEGIFGLLRCLRT